MQITITLSRILVSKDMDELVRDYLRKVSSFLSTPEAMESGHHRNEFFYLVPQKVHLEKAEELKQNSISVESFFQRLRVAPKEHLTKLYFDTFQDRLKLEMEQVERSMYHCSNGTLFSGESFISESVSAVPSSHLAKVHITNLANVAENRGPKEQTICIDINALRSMIENEPSKEDEFWEEDTRLNAVPLQDFEPKDLTNHTLNENGLGFGPGDLVFKKLFFNLLPFYMWCPSFLRFLRFLENFAQNETNVFPCVLVADDVRLFGLKGFGESALHGQKEGNSILVARNDYTHWAAQHGSVPISTRVLEPMRSRISNSHDVSTWSQAQWEDAFLRGTVSLTLLEAILYSIVGLRCKVDALQWQFDCWLEIEESSPWKNFVQAWNSVLHKREVIRLSAHNGSLHLESAWNRATFSTMKWLPIFRIVSHFAGWAWTVLGSSGRTPWSLIKHDVRTQNLQRIANFSVPADSRAIFQVSKKLAEKVQLLPFQNEDLIDDGFVLPPELNQVMWINDEGKSFFQKSNLARMKTLFRKFDGLDEGSLNDEEIAGDSSDSDDDEDDLSYLLNHASRQDSPESRRVSGQASTINPDPTPQWLSARDRQNLLQAFDDAASLLESEERPPGPGLAPTEETKDMEMKESFSDYTSSSTDSESDSDLVLVPPDGRGTRTEDAEDEVPNLAVSRPTHNVIPSEEERRMLLDENDSSSSTSSTSSTSSSPSTSSTSSTESFSAEPGGM